MKQFNITKRVLDMDCEEYNLTPTEKFVLATLSSYFGLKNGVFSCYPSQSTLALKTGYSVRTVNRALKSLEEKGILKSEFTQVGLSKLYTLKVFIKEEQEDYFI